MFSKRKNWVQKFQKVGYFEWIHRKHSKIWKKEEAASEIKT